jgi:microcystin-dependent protein
MAQPFIGEIRMFGGNFAPQGWALCDGQLLSIAENVALFTLIGTTYGGDGQSTFALPDLRGRVPVHPGAGIIIGEQAGEESVTLIQQQMPAHKHPSASSSPALLGDSYGGKVTGNTGTTAIYANSTATVSMDSRASVDQGGSLPHGNLMPFTSVNFIISLFGIFPSQS